MTGYSADYAMSNNALDAYERGLRPASKIGAGIPAALVERHCRPAEWHHSSKNFNRVDFYDPTHVKAVFGVSFTEDYSTADKSAVEALAAWRAELAAGPTIHRDCTVKWIDWTGSLRRPEAKPRTAEHATVSVKGVTATVTFADGRTMTKRLATRGFSYGENR